MPLTLKFDGKLLLDSGNGSVTAILDNGSAVIINTRIIISRHYPRGKIRNHIPQARDTFTTTIGCLPEDLQVKIRSDINKKQRKIHDETPNRIEVHRRSGGLIPRDRNGRIINFKPRPPEYIYPVKPPKSIDIESNYRLAVRSHSVHNHASCLEVGRQLVVVPQIPFDDLSYKLGTIVEFQLP